MYAAVVKLDTLADTVRAATQYHHLLAVGRLGFALFLVGGVHVGGVGGELGSAGIHALVYRVQLQCPAVGTHGGLVGAQQLAQTAVGEAFTLQAAQLVVAQAVYLAAGQRFFFAHQVFDLRQEPRVDLADGKDFVAAQADTEGVGYRQDAVRAREAQLVADLGFVGGTRVEAGQAGFQAAQGFLHGFLQRAAHGHHFAYRFHLGSQAVVSLREFLEGKTRDLGDDVVDGGLERSRGRAAGDVVLQLVQGKAHGQLGGDLCNREAGGFGCQRGRTRYTRVHLDHDHVAGVRVHGKLHVGTAGIHTDFTQYRQAGVTHDLVFLVGQRLCWRHGDGVAGVHAHRVEVFDGADDDAVVVAVTHHFHLVLFPAQYRLLDQQLVGGRGFEAALADGQELFLVVRNTAAGAAHGEGRANQRGVAYLGLGFQRLFHGVAHERQRAGQADLGHGFLEAATVFCFVDGVFGGTNQLDFVFFQHAVTCQVECTVQCGLAAHGRQDGVRALFIDDLFDHLPGNRLDIGDVGHVRVGHDGGRVGVHQNDFVTFFTQRLARLGAGVVKLAGLADDNRASANDENALDISTFRHRYRSIQFNYSIHRLAAANLAPKPMNIAPTEPPMAADKRRRRRKAAARWLPARITIVRYSRLKHCTMAPSTAKVSAG